MPMGWQWWNALYTDQAGVTYIIIIVILLTFFHNSVQKLLYIQMLYYRFKSLKLFITVVFFQFKI